MATPLPTTSIAPGPTGHLDLHRNTNVRVNEHDTQITSLEQLVAGIDERIRDVIGAALRNGTNVTINVDDAGDTITISATGGSGGTTDSEVVRDTIGAALKGTTGQIVVTVDDAGDTITISAPNLATKDYVDAKVAGQAPPLAARTNLFSDPMATALTRWGNALNYTASLVSNFPVPAALQDIMGATTTAVRSTRTATGASRLASPALAADMPVNGENVTLVIVARAGRATTVNLTARPQIANSASAVSLGSIDVTTDPQMFVIPGASYNTGTAGGGSAGFSMAVGSIASVTADDWVEVAYFEVDLGTFTITAGGDERPVWGGRPDTARGDYSWVGAANASMSTQSPITAPAALTGAAFGFVFAEDRGVTGAPLSDRANWATSLPDNSASWGVLLNYAHDNNLRIYLRPDRAYDLRGFQVVDINVRFVKSGGTVVTRSGDKSLGYYASIRHSPEAANFGIVVAATADATLVSNAGTPSSAEVHTALTLSSSANLAKFAAEDVWRITTNERYGWDGESGSPGNAWKAEQFDVLGVLYPVSSTNTIREGDTVVGATSGATGVVGSAPGTTGILLKSLSGTFTTTESLTVGGTAKGTMTGAGRVLVRGRLKDTYAGTLIHVAKMRTDLEVDFGHIVFDTVGDPEATIGEPNRQNSLNLTGVVRPKGIVTVKNAYGPAIWQGSVDRSEIELHVLNHVNNASTTGNAAMMEGAYGYGFEVTGSTRQGLYRGTGTRMRHWFTTNPLGRTNYPGGTNDAFYYFCGAVRECDVSADIWASWSAALDNHLGAYDLYFHDSTIRTSGISGERYYAGREGMQDRSCNTRYERVRIFGDITNGLNILSASRDWGVDSVTRIIDCYFEGILVAGIQMQTPGIARNTLEIIDNTFSMTKLPIATVGESGSMGIDIAAMNCTIRGNVVKNASFAYVNIRTGLAGATITFDGLRMDSTESAFSSPFPIRLATTTALNVFLHDIGSIESGGTWTTNRGAVHVTSGGTNPTIRRTFPPFALGNATALPMFTSGSASTAVTVMSGFA